MLNVPVTVTSCAGMVLGTSLHPLNVYPSFAGSCSETISAPYSNETDLYSSPSTIYFNVYVSGSKTADKEILVSI